MKRILSIILALMLLCSAAFAETVAVDLGNDGTMESFGVSSVLKDETNWSAYNVDLTFSRDDVLQDSMTITEYELPAAYRVRIMRMTDSLLFVEARTCVDTVATHYMVVGEADGKLTKFVDIFDTGISVGVEIKNALTGEDVFSSAAFDRQEVLDALESPAAFGIYGLTFKTAEYDFSNGGRMECATVNLPETSLLADISSADVQAAEQESVLLEEPDVIVTENPAAAADESESVVFTPVTGDELEVVTDVPAVYEAPAASSGSTATGETSSSSKNYVIANAGVNVRSNAGTSYEIIGSLANGGYAAFKGTIQKDNKGGSWYKISYNGGTGWVTASYTKLSDSKPSSEKKSSDRSSSKKYAIATGDVNIRKSADKDSSSLGSVSKGKTLTFKGTIRTDDRGVDWYKVSYDGSTGWVSSKYAKLSDSKGGNSESKDRTSSKKYAVTTGNVNIRKSADKDSSSLGSVSKGKTLTFKGTIRTDDRGVDWYKVSYDGGTGWVSSKYAKLSDSKGGSEKESESKSGKVVKTTGSANIRKSADKDSKSLGTVSSGKTLTYKGSVKTDSRGVDWYKVSFNGGTGWISEKVAKLVNK